MKEKKINGSVARQRRRVETSIDSLSKKKAETNSQGRERENVPENSDIPNMHNPKAQTKRKRDRERHRHTHTHTHDSETKRNGRGLLKWGKRRRDCQANQNEKKEKKGGFLLFRLAIVLL